MIMKSKGREQEHGRSSSAGEAPAKKPRISEDVDGAIEQQVCAQVCFDATFFIVENWHENLFKTFEVHILGQPRET